MEAFFKQLRQRITPPRKSSSLEEPPPAPFRDLPIPNPARPLGRNWKKDYPTSYVAARLDEGEATQAELFDPALKQFARAFRAGDLAFSDPEIARKWYAARTDAMLHVLRVVSESPCGDHLVLRGSLLLLAWLGAAAREPGDIDWVVTPQSLAMVEPAAQRLMAELVQTIRESPGIGETHLLMEEMAVDDIWTYERAPGRRIVIPWEAPGLPRGSVQMDLVFGEQLWEAPVITPIQARGDALVNVRAVTPALALAWKLLWLMTDMWAQGKDLYDAVLLAEQTDLSRELLAEVLEAGDGDPNELKPGFALRLDVDWDNFKREYPWIPNDVHEWKGRLNTALAPMFETDEDEYPRHTGAPGDGAENAYGRST